MHYSRTVEEYLSKNENWSEALIQLRNLLQSTELEETIKWGSPVYVLGNKNVVGIGAFKSYVGLWFYQGSFLADTDKVLINAQEGKTRALRQWRFRSVDEIDPQQVLAYVSEAIENQKKGLEIKPENKTLQISEWLQNALDRDSHLLKSFNQLSRGKKIEYAEYISEAKQDKTKQKRLEKIIPLIFELKGLNDKYKKS